MKRLSSRRFLLALVAVALLALPGCLFVRDVFWGMGDGAYSDGRTRVERESSYNNTLDRGSGRWDGGVGHYDPVLDR